MSELSEAFDQCIRRDPALRGLIGSGDHELCCQHLAAAAGHLARCGQTVWILTGFYVPRGEPPAAETDGPPGAAFLAAALQASGMDAWILTDALCFDAVLCAARSYGIAASRVRCCPDDSADIAKWSDSLRQDAEMPLTHLVAIERVGPAHMPTDWSDQQSSARFAETVHPDHWDRCHNMRGEIIDAVTPPLHAVVERVSRCQPAVRTIAVGDGGNEIGMGAIPWQEIRSRLVEPAASWIPCRIATDWTILAGVSNWGAMALGALVCHARGTVSVLAGWNRDCEEQRLQHLVQDGPAVDGVTRQQQATVDGLPFLTYLQPWEIMRQLLGLEG